MGIRDALHDCSTLFCPVKNLASANMPLMISYSGTSKGKREWGKNQGPTFWKAQGPILFDRLHGPRLLALIPETPSGWMEI